MPFLRGPRQPLVYSLNVRPALWLDATVGLYQERTGASATTLAASDGDPVGTWKDQSGNANHVTVPTADSLRPTWRTGIKNSLPAVFFDGSDDRMSVALGTTFPNKRGSWFFVFQRLDTSLHGTLAATYSAGIWQIFATHNTDTSFYKWFDGTAISNAAAADDTGWHVQSLIRSGDTTTVFANNDGSTETFTQTNNQPGTQSVFFGSNSVGTERLHGYLCEVLYFDRALNDLQRRRVRDYLNQKWAVY